MGLFASGSDALVWLCPLIFLCLVVPVIRSAFSKETSDSSATAGRVGTMLGRALSKWFR